MFSSVSEQSSNLFSNIPDISENVRFTRVALIFHNDFISSKHKKNNQEIQNEQQA